MSEPHAVFLSYASQDAEAAKRICDALRAGGIEVWFDQGELRGGDVWDRQIRKQIHDCALFIPIISAQSDARLEGYFRREWRLAVERTHDMAEELTFLLPVVIDDTTDRTAHVPDAFRQVQWTRLPRGTTTPAFLKRVQLLLAPSALAAAQHADGASDSPQAGTQAVRRMGTRSSTKLAIAAVLSVAVIGAGAYFAITRHRPKADAPGGPAAAPASNFIAKKSIAVLPFADLSEKHDQEYFGDGLAEEILDLLAKIPGLTVIGRTSSFQFKGRSSDLRSIGSALGVTYVVEGSIRKSGEHIKVTAQLIDARDGAHRWSETYDRQAADVLSLQRQIATAIARELQVSVTDYFGAEGTTKSAEAYDLYLRGIQDVDSGSREAEVRAISEFEKAVEIDPTYVNAWIGLADAYDSAATDRAAPRTESYRLAREAVDRALALDPKNVDALAMRAFIRMNTWDWSGADDDIRRSFALHKTNGAEQAAAKLAIARGDLASAEKLLRGVLSTDPLDTFTLDALAAVVYPRLYRFEESDRLFARLRDINPETGFLNGNLALNALYEGERDRALELAKRETDDSVRELALAVIYFAMGNIIESDLALHTASQMPTVQQYDLAAIYAYRGECDRAFEHLERAYEARSVDLLDLKTDLLVTNLRADPRYKAFLRKMNLPE